MVPISPSVWSLTPALLHFFGALAVFYPISKDQKRLDTLAVSSTSIFFISLIIGILGKKRSRVDFLKFYAFASSIGILLSLASVVKNNLILEVFQDLSGWEAKKVEILQSGSGAVLNGMLVQLFAVFTTVSLIVALILTLPMLHNHSYV